MPHVSLGTVSHAPLLTDPDTGVKSRFSAPHIKQSICEMGVREPGFLAQMNLVVSMWAQESDQAPAWVACPESPELESALAAHFGCPIGVPADWAIEISGPQLLIPYGTAPTDVKDASEVVLPGGKVQKGASVDG